VSLQVRISRPGGRDVARPEGGPAAGAPAPIERRLALDEALAEIRIGRRAGLELELPFPTVSGLHARVFRQDGGWAVMDLGSANGTFLAGARLTPHAPRPLALGQAFQVAEVSLTLEAVTGRPAGKAPSPETTSTIARRLVSDLFRAMGGAEAPTLQVVTGADAGAELRLAVPGRPYRVGREPSLDLVLADEDVSREHAVFERRWDGVFVRDLESKNGVERAGARLVGETRLRDGDHLVLGSTRLRFEDPEERYLRQMQDEPGVPSGSAAAGVAATVAAAEDALAERFFAAGDEAAGQGAASPAPPGGARGPGPAAPGPEPRPARLGALPTALAWGAGAALVAVIGLALWLLLG
jgi:pSer/pThr/pTyr-binding forkhead associated (FHA) protein